MKKMTIGRKLLKLNITVLSISLLFVVMGILSIIQDGAKKQFIESGSSILNYSTAQLEQVFGNAEQTLISIEEFYLTSDQSLMDLEQLMLSLQKSSNAYQHTFIVYKDGQYSLQPINDAIPDDFDPRTRLWYQDAVAQFGDLIWSDPYYDIDTQELVITCSKAFRDPKRNETIVIGLDMTISALDEMISALSSSGFGYMLLVNNRDVIVLHSDKSLVNSQLQSYNDDILIAEFHAQTPVYKTDTGIFMQKTLPDQKMFLMRYFSNDEITAKTQQYLYLFVMVIALFLLLGSLTTFYMSKRMTEPLIALKETITTGVSNDLLKECQVTTNDEIGEVIEGYNFLVGDINEKTLEMTALYEELAASEESLQEQYDELYNNREQIQMSEEKYRLISEATTQGLMELHNDNSITLHAKKWFDQFDLPKQGLVLQDWLALIHPDDLSMVNNELLDHLNKKNAFLNVEYRIQTTYGNYIWLSSVSQATFNADGSFKQMVAAHNDITQRKETEIEILNLAYTDGLTGLLNRSRLKDVISESMNNGEQGTMFYLDLDNFKFLNDTYGHSYGDQVLIQLSRRLNGCKDASCEIARISGDEFAVVIKDTLTLSQIEETAKKLLEKVSEKIVINNIEIHTTASIGAASYPYDANSFEDLLVNADISMHRAKGNSKNRFVIFTESIKNEMLASMNMERLLNQALSNDEISVHYQPVVRMADNKIVGFEALARWHSKELGNVPPDIFIPIAENNKLIIPLGEYVMKEALQFILALNKEFGTDYEIALNISAIQLEQEKFCSTVFNLIEILNYPISTLNLEVTESIELDSNPIITKNIKCLYDKGIPISLDDFGTGYSTFNNLIELPLSHLKIDKRMVQRSVTDDHVYKLIDSIVEFSHKMGIRVIAEGIEDMVMIDRMKDISIDFAQGYMYSKPVDGITLRQLVSKKRL